MGSRLNYIQMIHIQQYTGRRVKDGSTVKGYAAVSCESERAWIIVPAKGTDDKFHIVEVVPDSLVSIL